MPEATLAPPPAQQPPIPTDIPVAPDTSSPIDDAFADLDSMGQDTDQPQDKPAPLPPKREPRAAKPQPKTEPEVKPDEQVEEEKVEKPADKIEKAEKAEKPLKIPEIRKAYDKVKAELAALKAEREAEKQKATQVKPDESASNEWKEKLTNYEKQLEAERRRAKELDEKIQLTAFEQSDAYQKQFIEPLANAVKLGQQAVVGMPYVDNNGDTRAAVAEDFNEVLSATEFQRARAIAKARFPEDSHEVMSLWKDVKTRYEIKNAALVKWQQEAGQREEQRVQQEKAEWENNNKIWSSSIESAQQKYPDYFKPRENDPEGNAMFDRGLARAMAAFTGGKMKDENGNEVALSKEDTIKLHAEIMLKAASYNRTVRDLRAATKQIKELKAKLDGFGKSTPGSGDGGGQPAKPEKSWEDDLMAMGQDRI